MKENNKEILKVSIFALFVLVLAFFAINILLKFEEHICEPVKPEFELQHYYNANFGTDVYKFMDGSRMLGTIQTEKRLIAGERYTVIITKPE